ncbi:MAG: hypothetical protein R3F07_06160 [Opitutaceae bacterium]
MGFRSQIKAILATVWVLAVSWSVTAQDLGADSPFLPPDAGQPAPAPVVPVTTLANLEFSGVMSFGRQTLISVHDLQSDKSVWITVGGEEEGIRVVNYDSETKEITVLSRGVTTRLKLRESQLANGKWIKPLPTLEQEYGRPLTVEEEETEARMLVSDLLEIGMKERERQRELRKQAAAGKRPN